MGLSHQSWPSGRQDTDNHPLTVALVAIVKETLCYIDDLMKRHVHMNPVSFGQSFLADLVPHHKVSTVPGPTVHHCA